MMRHQLDWTFLLTFVSFFLHAYKYRRKNKIIEIKWRIRRFQFLIFKW